MVTDEPTLVAPGLLVVEELLIVPPSNTVEDHR